MASEYQRSPTGVLKEPFKILLVEDNRDDVELCLAALRRASLEAHVDVVTTPEEFAGRICVTTYDVVLADYALGTWNGLEARNLLRDAGSEAPFILVTGALGEQMAVECLKNGVTDYILKDRLERLPAAILRALEEKGLRDERQRAERSLRESEEKFRTLAETLPAATFVERGTRCCYVNRAAEEITGYSREELLGMNFWEFVHPDSRKTVLAASRDDEPSVSRHEVKILTKSSEARWLDVTVGMFQLEGALAALITAFDITARKREENGIPHQLASDPLTGLANDSHLREVFNLESKRSSRTGRSFSLLLVDLDALKKINETQGRAAGDSALCRLAHTLLHCRAEDTPARIAGDRFALILPETGAAGALALGLRIARRLAAADEPMLSCSFGAAVYPQDGNTIDRLIEVARRALRTVKTSDSGRLHVMQTGSARPAQKL